MQARVSTGGVTSAARTVGGGAESHVIFGRHQPLHRLAHG